jgi:uncharacterized glyoxalase superfamily protein PhnB
MSDPFDALRRPPEPLAPSPAFAIDLRRRVEQALASPPPTTGGAMSTTVTTAPHIPERLHSITPYLAVEDARRAIDWYVEHFAAVPLGDPYVMEDGRIGHAELRNGGSVIMLADEFPELDVLGPRARGGPSVMLTLYLEDADATVERALAGGAVLERPVEDQFYGARAGVIRDPFGHRWTVATQLATAAADDGHDTVDLGQRRSAGAPGERHGDVGYFTLGIPDADRARAFYGELLGWTFEPGSVDHGFQIADLSPMGGLWGGQAGSSVTLCYRVDDVAASVAKVRALGGSAEDAVEQPYGLLAECVDDQGTPFQLWQPPPGG